MLFSCRDNATEPTEWADKPTDYTRLSKGIEANGTITESENVFWYYAFIEAGASSLLFVYDKENYPSLYSADITTVIYKNNGKIHAVGNDASFSLSPGKYSESYYIKITGRTNSIGTFGVKYL